MELTLMCEVEIEIIPFAFNPLSVIDVRHRGIIERGMRVHDVNQVFDNPRIPV
jgi:hypothetical protein